VSADWRLTRERLEAERLPLELEAYDYYPEGVHIPVSWVGCVIVTGPWEAPPERSDPAAWCTLGVYAIDGDGGDAAMIDLRREELSGAVVELLCEIRHDDDWLRNANQRIRGWFAEGRG
jgi:hypothetical protein